MSGNSLKKSAYSIYSTSRFFTSSYSNTKTNYKCQLEKTLNIACRDFVERYFSRRLAQLRLAQDNHIELGNAKKVVPTLNLLHLLFMDLKSSDEKEKILHDEYDVMLTRDMRKNGYKKSRS